MKPLEVIFYDSVFRCHVRSQTNPKRTYLVDLEGYGGVGFCGCQHFQFNCGPALAKLNPSQLPQEGRMHRCAHIRAARKARAYQLLDQIIADRRKQHDTNPT